MNNTQQKEMLVVKASGEVEPFSEAKLRNSLERSKASSATIAKVIAHIRQEFVSGSKTHDIYKHAFSLLRKHERPAAARYSLKRAIMELGPTGHPFENLVGELLKLQGFSVTVAGIVQGLCVSHEVDVVAEQGSRHIMVECKFHNEQGIKSDVKVALYVEARFQDVEKAWQKDPAHTQKFHEAWLVTNTQLTSDAIAYASCVGMKAIGWDYPKQGSLQDLIERSGLHPLTCLTTLSGSNKRVLLDKGLVLCKDVARNKKALQAIGFNQPKIAQVEKEITQLCGIY
ncbi:MAG: restriction endonuclease [Parcubacteria group bacterium]|nr:restriction endonuclease [Parcubacteria group bacterium]